MACRLLFGAVGEPSRAAGSRRAGDPSDSSDQPRTQPAPATSSWSWGELDLDVGAGPVVDVELRVEDGDDPPLEWTRVAARVPVAEVYFAASAGDYALLFDDPEARRPSCELERVRDLVLAVDSTRVEAGELAENLGRGAFARFRGEGGWQQVLLWAALILAALILAAMTLRLARQDPPAD